MDTITTIVAIQGAGAPWDVQLKELWRYRELLYFLAWRDIKVRYQQTALGVVWAVLQPLAIALSLSLFLGRIVRMPADGLPYPVFAYSAMLIWQLFAQALTDSSNSLIENERLITKIYFPRLLIPLSSVLCSLLDFAISSVVLVLFLIHYRLVPSFSILLLPIPVLLAVVLAFGVGLSLGALNVRYRDVRYTMGFIVQLWFLCSPIAYPVSSVPEKWRALYALNPMVGIVEGFRWALHGTGRMPIQILVTSGIVSMLCLLTGLYYFRRTEETFADFI